MVGIRPPTRGSYRCGEYTLRIARGAGPRGRGYSTAICRDRYREWSIAGGTARVTESYKITIRATKMGDVDDK